MALTGVNVGSGLVRVREPSPTADVVDQNSVEARGGELHIPEKGLKSASTFEVQPTLAGVLVGLDDLHAVRLGVFSNCRSLVLRGVALMLGGHAHILGNRDEPSGALISVGHCVVRGHGQRFPSRTMYSATVGGRFEGLVTL